MDQSSFLIVELGHRLAAGACGSLLAQLGATVVFVEAAGTARDGKFAQRGLFAASKQSLRPASGEDPTLARLLARCDAVIVSSDVDPGWIAAAVPTGDGAPVVCDITSFGSDDPLSARRYSDRLIQAVAGIMETSGRVDGPPMAIGAPVVELSTGLYAAAAILAALRQRRVHGVSQRIDMALYDCAVNALATFLPAYFGGGRPRRLGNGHSMAVPWNAYRASDGWVLLCSTSDPQWAKISEVIGRPELARDPRYATLADRLARREEVDALVQDWTRAHGVEACIAALGRANIPSGPIARVRDLAEERNLVHRRTLRSAVDPDGRWLTLPGTLFHGNGAFEPTFAIPTPDAGRSFVERATEERPIPSAPSRQGEIPLPLDGVRVVEIGQFTTAPLASRHLAMLGAEVIKIEPPQGDTARQWAPHRDGLSFFFVISNSGKRSIGVDLRTEDGADFFRRLVAGADVLVENMKPGSLGRLGFGAEALAALNPRLVYCAISGFGADAAYPERPAFDTVVQAMCGLMDLTREADTPLKAGISIADICGGELAIVAILAALEAREATGRGRAIDLSMQDAGAWLTQLAWNAGETPEPSGGTIACSDGFVEAEGDLRAPELAAILASASSCTRDALAAALAGHGVPAVPVRTVAEVAEHPQTRARGLIARTAADGSGWPVLASPLKLRRTPPRVGNAIGEAEPLAPSLLTELGLA